MMLGALICRRLDMTSQVTHALRTVSLIFFVLQSFPFFQQI